MKKSKVLIIDDEPDICVLLSGMLRSMGYDPLYALNLADGFDQFKNIMPPMVFMDLSLPDGSGFSLISKIKALSPKTKIVMISAHDGDKERRTANEHGASYFIGKPLNRQLVMDAVNAFEHQNKLLI